MVESLTKQKMGLYRMMLWRKARWRFKWENVSERRDRDHPFEDSGKYPHKDWYYKVEIGMIRLTCGIKLFIVPPEIAENQRIG